MKYYLLLVIMTMIASLASVFLKRASSNNSSIWKMVYNKNIYVGGGLYVLAALLNVYVLKFLDYSIVMPMGAVTYIWTILFSAIFFDEKINRKEIIGVGLILLGTISIVI